MQFRGLRRTGVFLAVCAAVFGLKAQSAPTHSLEYIMEIHKRATHFSRWEWVNSLRIVHVDEDGRRSTELIQKPNKYQLIFELPDGGELIKSYDGTTGWISKNGQLLPMDPGEVIEMAEEVDFHVELATAHQKRLKMTVKPDQIFNGREVMVIELEKSPEDVQTYFLDKETYLLAAVSEYSHDSKWKGTYFQTQFEDYHYLPNQMPWAHSFGLKVGDKPEKWFVMESIELNPILIPEVFQQPKSGHIRDGKSLLAAMHAAASRSSLQTYTFEQQTIRFDSLGQPLTPSTWYEALQYPDKFRIDVGEPIAGRAVIYRNDSSYHFKEGKLVRATADPMKFMLLEGALKCYALDTVVAKVTRMGYDMGKFHVDEFQDKPMYVLGANKGDLKSKQIWVEQRRLIPIRRIDPEEDGTIVEVVYGGFERLKGKWVETTVDIFVDGKKFQTEKYSDLNAKVELRPSLFDPKDYGTQKWHWLYEEDQR